MSEDRLRIAIVGLGKMGLLHAGILDVLPGTDLVAFCDKSRIMRIFFKKVFKDISIVDDVGKLRSLDLDAVYVTTPIPSHFPVAKTILQQGIARHLFVEKTLASNHRQAMELCHQADRVGGVNMVGYLRRYAVTFRKARDLLAQDVIGELTSFKAYAYSSDFSEASEGSETSASRGGVLSDLGCHVIDIALWLFGDLEVHALKPTSPPKASIQDSLSFMAENTEGLRGDFDISWCIRGYRMPEVGLSIDGSKGTIEVNDDAVKLTCSKREAETWYRHDLDDSVPFWLGGPEYYREDQHFIESVKNKSHAEPDFREASNTDRVIEQVILRADER